MAQPADNSELERGADTNKTLCCSRSSLCLGRHHGKLYKSSFAYEKLKSPTYDDLIDVFEDRMRSWFLLPAARFLEIPHYQIAAVGLLITYCEGQLNHMGRYYDLRGG